MDSTAILSRSEIISLLEQRHNSKYAHITQINVMILFSSVITIPTFVRIFRGSIRDVLAMSKAIEIAGIDRCVIVADKGFVG